MASSAATCDVQRPNPRSRATPRRLNYSKCEQCRDPKIKAKCEPQSREWPGERCQNCIKRGFPCSAPQRTRKGGRRLKAPTAAALKSTAAKTPRTLGNTSSQETVHQVLVLLSVKCLIEMALQESWSVYRNMLENTDNNSDVVEHLFDIFLSRAGVYKATITELQTKIVENSSPKVLSAIFDLAATQRLIEGLDEVDMERMIASYRESEHDGIVYILTIKSLRILSRYIDHHQLRQCRERLLAEWPNAVYNFDFDASESFLELQELGIDLSINQVFVPQTLLESSLVAVDVFADGRPDCLGRYHSRNLMSKESGTPWFVPNSKRDKINVDVLGRDEWYLVCCKGDYEGLRTLQEAATETPGSILSTYASTPFASHLEAALGHTNIFRMLRRAPSAIWDSVMRAVDDEDLTCLAVAAACDHRDLVEFMCQVCNLETLDQIWAHKVPLHIAVDEGHSAIVSSFVELLKDLKPAALDYARPERDVSSPFWCAVRSGNSSLMRMLAPYANIDRKCRGCTPLHLAIINDSKSTVACLFDINDKTFNQRKIEINAPLGPDGITAFDIAAKGGKREIVDILMAHGARTGTQPPQWTYNDTHAAGTADVCFTVMDFDGNDVHIQSES